MVRTNLRLTAFYWAVISWRRNGGTSRSAVDCFSLSRHKLQEAEKQRYGPICGLTAYHCPVRSWRRNSVTGRSSSYLALTKRISERKQECSLVESIDS